MVIAWAAGNFWPDLGHVIRPATGFNREGEVMIHADNQKIRIIIPEAPAVLQKVVAAGNRRKTSRGELRIGLLDNGKANAGHLLRHVEERLRAILPVKSSIVLRKAHVGVGASAAFLDRLAAEADFVISAMAE